MTKGISVLSALFESKSACLMRQVSARNASLCFPVGKRLSLGGFAASCGEASVLISGGGDDERAALICALLPAAEGVPAFIISCGNPWLSEHALRERGLAAERLHSVAGCGMSARQQMAVMTAADPECTLSAFWQFAFEVCRALGLPAEIETVASIDWQEFDWQLRLLQKAPAEVSGDLLARFDRDMAKCAVKASVLMEKLLRGAGREGVRLDEALRTGGVYCAAVPNSASAVTKHLLEALEDAAERGSRFLLVLDDVYLKDQALIREDPADIRLILSNHDLCAAAPELAGLTQRSCDVALFRHTAMGNAEKLSAHFFGMYERRYAERSVTDHRNRFSPFSEGSSEAVSIRIGRDYRLDPELIGRLPRGAAFVRSASLGEGLMLQEPWETGGVRKRIEG